MSSGSCSAALERGPHTSIPVVLETFTYLERKVSRDVALAWKAALYAGPRASILACDVADLDAAWAYLLRSDLHKLSLVDATSFAIMKRAGISLAFTFDYHFAVAGFRPVG